MADEVWNLSLNEAWCSQDVWTVEEVDNNELDDDMKAALEQTQPIIDFLQRVL